MTCSVSMSHKTRSWNSSASTWRWQAGRLICRAGGKSRSQSRSGGNRRTFRPAAMGQLHQARQGSIRRQGTEEPLRLAVLAWEGTLPEQPPFWPGPTAPMGDTVARRARSRVDAKGQELLAQGPPAARAPCHRLPGFLWLGCRDHLNVIARRWTRLLGLSPPPRAWCLVQRSHRLRAGLEAKVTDAGTCTRSQRGRLSVQTSGKYRRALTGQCNG